jgi:hypothetical protein
MFLKSGSKSQALSWAVLSALGIGAIAFGILSRGTPVPIYWNLSTLTDVLVWIVGCLLIAGLARWLTPGRPRTVMLGLAGVYVAGGLGGVETAAAVLFFLSCFCCGRLALETAFPDEDLSASVTKPIMVGLACELALFAILIHLPINNGPRWLLLQALPVIAFLARRRPSLAEWAARWNGGGDVLQSLRFWPLAVAVAMIGVGVRYAFLPAVDFDNNSEHLRLWTELAYLHRFSFDVHSQVWNVEPYVVDLMRAIVSLGAGRDARTALGMGMLLLLFRQLWVVLARFDLKAADRLLLIVLFMSTPMAGWLLASMQAELMLALLAVTGARLTLDARPETGRGDAVAILALAALCCGVKLPGAVLGAWLILAAAPKLPREPAAIGHLLHPNRLWPIALFVAIFAVTALGSYVTAWRVTHNPLFPLYNGVFKSPDFLLQNFADERWIKGFSLKSFIGLFFRSSQFGENQDLVAGFQYLFLAPAGVIVLASRYRANLVAWAICLPLLGFGLMMFSQTQYMRYAFPVMPLAILAIGGLLAAASATAVGAWSIRLSALLCIVLNLFFYPGISWEFMIAPQRGYTESGRRGVIAEANPAKVLVEDINTRDQGARVLFPQDSPFGAALRGEPLYVNWYAPLRQARYQALRSEADVNGFMKAERISWVIWDTGPATKPGEPAALLGAWLNERAVPEKAAGGYVSYAVLDGPPAYHTVFDLGRTPAAGTSLAKDAEAKVIGEVALNDARIMRYRVQVRCADPRGAFVAQINFDRGGAYYRLVHCDTGPVEYEEAFPLPARAMKGQVYASFRNSPGGIVTGLTVETN